MISKKIKKVMCCATIVTCLLGIGATSYASTTNYTLTLTKSGQNADTLSLRTIKDDNEDGWYLTATYASEKGADVYGKSVMLNNKYINSNPTSLTNLNYTQKTYYNSIAPAGEYYYLEGIYGRSKSGSVNLRGRYTP